MARVTQSKYRKERPQKIENNAPDPHEIRVSAKNSPGVYINRGAELLLGEKKEKDQENFIIFRAIENAIPNALKVVEVLRMRIPGLYLISKIDKAQVKDTYIPKEEGLKIVTVERTLSLLEIKLTNLPSEDEKKQPGFQDQLPADQVQPKTLEEIKGRSPRNDRSYDNRYPPRKNNNRGEYHDRRPYNDEGRKPYRDDKDGKGNYKRDYDDRRPRRGGDRDRRPYDDRRDDKRDDRREKRDYNDRPPRQQYRDDRDRDRPYHDRDSRDNKENNNKDRGAKRERGGKPQN